MRELFLRACAKVPFPALALALDEEVAVRCCCEVVETMETVPAELEAEAASEILIGDDGDEEDDDASKGEALAVWEDGERERVRRGLDLKLVKESPLQFCNVRMLLHWQSSRIEL